MHWCTIVALLLLKVKNDHRRSHKRELFLNANFFILPPQFTYELFHIYFTPFHSLREIWTQQIDLVPNVWLHSSVGRASHRYRRGHGFKSRWSLDIFRLLLSNCLNWKINCDDHSSLPKLLNVKQQVPYQDDTLGPFFGMRSWFHLKWKKEDFSRVPLG